MSLFNFGKKKEEEKKVPSCCCGTAAEDEGISSCCGTTADAVNTSSCCGNKGRFSNIKVLGAGCKSCHEQYENAKSAVEAMGLGVEVEYITDMEKVMAYGVMSMPALVVNDKVVSMGRVLKAADVEKLLKKLGA